LTVYSHGKLVSSVLSINSIVGTQYQYIELYEDPLHKTNLDQVDFIQIAGTEPVLFVGEDDVMRDRHDRSVLTEIFLPF